MVDDLVRIALGEGTGATLDFAKAVAPRRAVRHLEDVKGEARVRWGEPEKLHFGRNKDDCLSKFLHEMFLRNIYWFAVSANVSVPFLGAVEGPKNPFEDAEAKDGFENGFFQLGTP